MEGVESNVAAYCCLSFQRSSDRHSSPSTILAILHCRWSDLRAEYTQVATRDGISQPE